MSRGPPNRSQSWLLSIEDHDYVSPHLYLYFKPVRNAMARGLFWILLRICSLSWTISARRPRWTCPTDPVVGLEFTLDAVIAAVVEHENGTVLETRRIEGTSEYKALMWRWFEMCEEIHNGTVSDPRLHSYIGLAY